MFSAYACSLYIHIYVSSKQLNDNHRHCWQVLGKEKEGEKTNQNETNKNPQTWRSQ